jgi:outer membrane protein assembly factor BamB
MTAKRRRLGWLGPVIVLVGIAAAALATWFMVVSRPKAGAVVDTIAIDQTRSLVVRAEQDGERNFVELRDGERVAWQAYVPPYAGRPGAPGIAWNDVAVSVRVIRDGRAEIFAIAFANGSKLGGFKLAPGKGAVTKQTSGPITLTDHVRSYEIVSGVGWNQLVAIDLGSGEARWKQDLDGAVIEAGGVDGDFVWIRQAGRTRRFRALDGSETASASST